MFWRVVTSRMNVIRGNPFARFDNFSRFETGYL
jgi:hypothetical protein